jgi:hypothetical protein
MATDESLPPAPARRPRTVICLIALATLFVAGACDDRSYRPSPIGPSDPSAPTALPQPSVHYTAPVEGVVRIAGGAPVAHHSLRLWGATDSPTTTSDASGRFRFASHEISSNWFAVVLADLAGHEAGALHVPQGPEPPPLIRGDVVLQPKAPFSPGGTVTP